MRVSEDRGTGKGLYRKRGFTGLYLHKLVAWEFFSSVQLY